MADQWDDVAAALFPDAAHAKPMTMAAARELAAAALRAAYEQGQRDDRDHSAQVAEALDGMLLAFEYEGQTENEDKACAAAHDALAAIRSRSTNDGG